MESGTPDGRDESEYNGVSFVEISKTFVAQDIFFFGTICFDGVYQTFCFF